MEFRYIDWQQDGSVAERYIRSFEQVRELYEHDYRDWNVWKSRAAYLDGQSDRRAAAQDIMQALLQYNEKIGNHPHAIRSVKRLSDPETLVVAGGQQAGLFTGPLLVIHKAISIIRTARYAEARLGRPVVPLFWIAGEDHDYDEVNHIYQLSPQLSIEKIELPQPSALAGKRLTVSRRPVMADEWEKAIGFLDDSLQQTEFKANLLAMTREAAAASRGLADAFARMMARWFGQYGLIMLDSDDPQLRKAESAMFRQLVSGNAQLERALQAGKSAMESLGFTPSAEVREGGANLFYMENDERLLLYRSADGSRFFDKSGAVELTAQELEREAGNSPEAFSNNVFTRPLMQDYLFPVLATVLGPGEISYWGLTREAFRAFDMQMPIIVPRTEFTLVEGTVRKQLDKLGLSLEDALFRLNEKKTGWLAAQDSQGLAERFAETKRRFDELYAPVLQLVGSINPGLRTLGETNRLKIAEQIDFLESRAKDAFESQFEAAVRQFERIRLSLTPFGKKQERVYNVLAYFNKYGPGWLDPLITADFEDNGKHVVVYL